MDIARRELVLIAGGTLTTALLSWLTADPVIAGQLNTGHRIGESAVATVEERARMLRRMDDQDGGGTVLVESTSALALTVGLLRSRTYTDAHGRRLYAAASDLARQRAAALFDISGECSDGAFESSLRAAHMAQDNAVGANCLGFWSVAAYNTGRLRDAEAMADTALASVRGRGTPRTEAMLATRRGRARAHSGDARCWADFDRAEELLAQAEHGDDAELTYWFDDAEILGARASSHRDLAQFAEAEASFAKAHDLFDPTCVRTHALYLSRQADAQYAQGQLEQACSTGHQALDLTEAISSQRTTGLLLDMAGRLARSRVPAARAFRDRVATTLHAPSSSPASA